MRRTLGLAALAVAAAAPVLPLAPASACDPDRFPYCTTYCRAVVSRYELVRDAVDRPSLPAFPRTGVAGCP